MRLNIVSLPASSRLPPLLSASDAACWGARCGGRTTLCWRSCGSTSTKTPGAGAGVSIEEFTARFGLVGNADNLLENFRRLLPSPSPFTLFSNPLLSRPPHSMFSSPTLLSDGRRMPSALPAGLTGRGGRAGSSGGASRPCATPSATCAPPLLPSTRRDARGFWRSGEDDFRGA
eukprot:218387-Rhodomonas_salina.1